MEFSIQGELVCNYRGGLAVLMDVPGDLMCLVCC